MFSAPLLDANFTVEIGVMARTAASVPFSQVLLPRLELPVANDRRLILRRPATGALDLYEWYEAERLAPSQHGRFVAVSVTTPGQRQRMMGWQFDGIRPTALSYGMLDALSGTILIETIELRFDAVTIVNYVPKTNPPDKPK